MISCFRHQDTILVATEIRRWKMSRFGTLLTFLLFALVAGETSHAARTDVTAEKGVDLPGLDYKSFWLPKDDPELCRQACADDEKCKAYTYVKPGVQGPQARCFLKGRVPSAKRNDCCVSGVKTAQTPTVTTSPPVPGPAAKMADPKAEGSQMAPTVQGGQVSPRTFGTIPPTDKGPLTAKTPSPVVMGKASQYQPASAPPQRVLVSAQQAEMSRVLQPAGISGAQLTVLRQLDIEAPEDLARYKGREDQLHRVVAGTAAAAGASVPTKAEVAKWVQLALSTGVRPSPSRALTPDLRKPPVKMRPTRPISIAYWNPSMTAFPTATRVVELVKPVSLVPALLGEQTVHFTLKPGQKELLKDFHATEPGLYRADIAFARQGGFVTLQWRVERSNGAPVVQYGKPLEILDIVQGKAAKYAYFWLTSKDIAGGNPMRFHIAVSRNEDYKEPSPYEDPIEQSPVPVTVIDPTITGSIFVTRQSPIKIAQIGKADVPILNKPDPNQINYPIQYLEMPYYKPVPRPPTIMFPLEVTLNPDPNTYRDPYVENGITKADPGIVWHNLQVMRDDAIVTWGQTTSHKGVTKYKLNNPDPGVYRILAWSTSDTLQDIVNTGIVKDQNWSILEPIRRIIVDARLDGGKMPWAYVAELWRLEVSDQSEPDNDGNDDGQGEFKLESHTILGRIPVDQLEQKYLDQNPQAWLQEHPVVATRVVYPEFKHINMPGYSNIHCYPYKLLSWWTDDDADSANRILSVFSTVVEDDDLTWWQQYGDFVVFYVKSVVSLIKAAYGGDISGIANVFKDAIVDSTSASGWGLERVDDIVGYTVYSSSKNQGYGLLIPGEVGYGLLREFNAEGNGKPELIDTASAPPPTAGAHIPANVSKKIGSLKPWASTGIKIQKAPALWSRRLRVQLLEFQLTWDFAFRQAKGPDNTIWWPITMYSTYGETTIENMNVNPLPNHEMPKVKCAKPPTLIGDHPNDWQRVPARYLEIGLWESEPGADAFAGIVSMTVYPGDFLTAAAASPQAAKPLPLDQAAKDAFLRGDMAEVRNNSHVVFYKSGSDYVGEFTIHDPGYHLDYVKFRVLMEIWGV